MGIDKELTVQEQVEQAMQMLRPKHEFGYDNEEAASLCLMLDADVELYGKHLGVRTALIEDGKLITYERDVYHALVKTLKKVKPYIY